MKAALGFILLAVVAGALIGITRMSTVEAIALNKANAAAAIVADLLGGKPDPQAMERLCSVKVRGYAGTIHILVLPEAESSESKTHASNAPHKRIVAVRVLSHSETPGIGDFIDLQKSSWIRSFHNLLLRADREQAVDELSTKLDAITGATITRRAVINGVAQACPF